MLIAVSLKSMLSRKSFGSVKENSFKKPDKNKILHFKDLLVKKGVNATVRRTLGADIDASCGQLRKRVKEGEGSENIQ